MTLLASMEHFLYQKKNRMGQTKSSDISQIDKKCFRDMNWLKQNVTKRVILRLTMTHFDPIGAHLSIVEIRISLRIRQKILRPISLSFRNIFVSLISSH